MCVMGPRTLLISRQLPVEWRGETCRNCRSVPPTPPPWSPPLGTIWLILLQVGLLNSTHRDFIGAHNPYSSLLSINVASHQLGWDSTRSMVPLLMPPPLPLLADLELLEDK